MSDLPKLRLVRPLLGLPLLAVLTAPASAQEPPAAGGFGETVEVRVVNIEAVVTDKDGLPVTGLEPGDFLLKIDGQEVPIGYFTEVRGGDAVAPTPAEEGAAPAPPGMPALSPGTPVGTSYLVYIDDYFSIARDRDVVLERIVADLPRLGPEDRMAVVAYDGRELKLITSWTGSTSALTRAFRTAKSRPSFGIERYAELRTLENERRDYLRMGLQFQVEAEGRLREFERDYAERLEAQLKASVAAATAALRGFAAPPGRKVMMLLAGGWPWEVGEYAAGSRTLRDEADSTLRYPRYMPDATLARGAELYGPIADTANQLGYTLYPVDVPGLAPPISDPEYRRGGEAQLAGGDHFDRKANLHFTLNEVAEETGGRALLNAQRLDAFVVAQADTRSYYWLGFTPTWKGDDSRHAVELTVRRPGLRIRTRQGYVDISRRREVTMAVESGLIFGSPPSADLLGLEVGAAQSGKRGRITMPFTVSVPGDQIVFLPEGESQMARLELRIAAVNERGDRSDVPVIPVEIKVRRAALPGEQVTFQSSVELSRAKQRVLFALFDPLSGRLFTAMHELKP